MLCLFVFFWVAWFCTVRAQQTLNEASQSVNGDLFQPVERWSSRMLLSTCPVSGERATDCFKQSLKGRKPL